MKQGYLEAKRMISEEPFYQEFIKKNLASFPSVDCPEEYKVALCAVAKGEAFDEFLNYPLEAVGNRTLMEVIKSKDFDSLERYIHECIFLDIMGPGSY